MNLAFLALGFRQQARLLAADTRVLTLDSLFSDICVLVTAALALTLMPGLRLQERSLLSMRDRGTALLVFLLLGLVEEASVLNSGWLSERIVAVCVAGLVAGPWVGLAVAAFATWLAVSFDGLPLAANGISMLCGGLVGGWLYRWRPKLAQHPATGFCLTLAVSFLRRGIFFLSVSNAGVVLHRCGHIGMAPALEGLGTALILAIVAQTRDRDEQTRTTISAEVRALQARMDPHFLFNALNTLAALSRVTPREVPRAVARLRRFLRTSFDQHDRALVPLEEELAVVWTYLDIEVLRFGSRLKVEQRIDPSLLKVLMPPFSLQPLVENAVKHGLRSRPKAGRLRLEVHPAGQWLEMSVSDDGQGIPATEIEKTFFAEQPRAHALALLRRRLQGLFGSSFHLEVRSDFGRGTTVTIRLPLRRPVEVEGRSLEGKSTNLGQLAPTSRSP